METAAGNYWRESLSSWAIPDEIINNIIKDIQNEYNNHEIQYFEHEIISHIAEKLLKIEMSDKHHETSFAIGNEDFKGILNNPSYDGNFSLFFFKENSIFEWREFSGEILQISKNN